jgi:Cell division protein CrgA
VQTHNENGVSASTRYTPPVPKYLKQSPQWVPILMFALLILGALIILMYYLGAVPGGRSNLYLVAGLGFILGGLYTATKYH